MTALELAIAYNVRPEILELLSDDMTKSEIAAAIEKGSFVGESAQECVLRLGVKTWRKLFVDTTCFTEIEHDLCRQHQVVCRRHACCA